MLLAETLGFEPYDAEDVAPVRVGVDVARGDSSHAPPAGGRPGAPGPRRYAPRPGRQRDCVVQAPSRHQRGGAGSTSPSLDGDGRAGHVLDVLPPADPAPATAGE